EISAAQAVVQIGGRSHLAGIAAMMMDSGAPGLKKSIAADLGKVVKKHKIASCVESVDIVNDERISHFGSAYLYPKRTAILGLSIRLAHNAQGTLLRTADDDEEVLSVGEMLGRGLKAPNAGSQCAIRVSKPVQGTDRDVPMVPYVFGIWLGDGQTAGGRSLANPDVEILDRIEAAGYKVERGTFDKVTDPDQWCTHQVTNWSQDLQATGAVGDKHIPISYATASVQQRFELLRGLMDSDGTIDAHGNCELSLSHQRLAEDALDLIRSLGIKASMTTGAAGYRDKA